MNKPKFHLKDSTKKQTSILMFFYFNGKRYVYSPKLKINPKFWNEKAMRVRYSQELPDADRMNDLLEKVESTALIIARDHELTLQPLTTLTFEREMNVRLLGKTENGAKIDFTGYVDKFITERSSMPKYAAGSVQVYNTAKKHLKNYTRDKRVNFEDLTVDFFFDFIRYLYKQKFSDNHVNKILGTIRTILNEATEGGLNKNMAYKSRKLIVSKTETDNVYLNESDLAKLIKLNLKDRPGLDRVRDLFLIGAYTGLRFSDFSNLKPENVQQVEGHPVFNILTTKTIDRLIIPIHPIVNEVLKKYHYNLPAAITNQKMNDALKDICRIADLSTPFIKRNYQGGRPTELTFKKWQVVGSHTARRSFATNAYIAGVPMLNIMRITGHKKPETFLKYIKFDNAENAIITARHQFFNPAYIPAYAVAS